MTTDNTTAEEGSQGAEGLSTTPQPVNTSGASPEQVNQISKEPEAQTLPSRDDGPQPRDGGGEKPVRPKKSKKATYAVAEDSDSSNGYDPDFYSNIAPSLYEEWKETIINYAAKLDTASLYQAYLEKLERKSRTNEEGHGSEQHGKPTGGSEGDKKMPKLKKVKGATMVSGIIDYTKMLEDRIKKLEEAVAERTKHQLLQQKTGAGTAAADTKPEEVVSAEKHTELIMEAKFFSSEGEFNPDGEWKENVDKTGSYQCSTDPKYIIRVLYAWANGITPRDLHGNAPLPHEIDILGFGILSEPIAAFFSSRLNFAVGNSHLIRMGAPFVPLIRNLEPVRAQLTKLEGRYGSDDAGSPNATQNRDESIAGSGFKDGDTAKETDDPLPFPASSVEGPEEQFESKEALAHFRILLEFVDVYFARQLLLLQRLRLGQEEKIAFQDLWMLFDAGDSIYCPFQEGGTTYGYSDDRHTTKTRYLPQIFRVLGTTGGLPLRKTLAPRVKIRDEYDDDDDVWGKLLVSGFFKQRGLTRAAVTPPSGRARDRFTPLRVVCFHVDFDGVRYGTVREIFSFKPYDGLVDIRSLEAYPTQYLRTESNPQTSELDRYLSRGRKFIDVTAVSHLSYESLTVGNSREEINSAVIVDIKLAFQEYEGAFASGESVVPKLTSLIGYWPPAYAPEVLQLHISGCDNVWCHNSSCMNDCYFSFHADQVQKVEPKMKALLEEHESGKLDDKESLKRFKAYMEEKDLIRLLPGTVPGFALRNRKWVQLDLEKLQSLPQGDEWHKLVLPTGHRDMVQAMVETHTKGSQEMKQASIGSSGKFVMDLVQGKGRGCIILLHGVPGVGKTSTAECVASYTRRPLYPITCGDIGYVPEAVEKNMEGHFKLAHKWGCVLLLDEADVFLAKRSKGDVKRNGLVSVFLRILEYYSGILFLTTNRVGAIDDAFRSRLHLTLYYPKLTKKQTIKIWKNNLDRLKDINKAREDVDQSPIEFDKKKILKWVERNWDTLQWNGRQIRNAFQTAVALAQFTAKMEAEEDRRRYSSKKATGKQRSRSRSRTPRPPVMGVHHFKLIADASMQFSEYLQETHGIDEDLMAHRDEIRALAFEPKVKRKELQEVESSSTESDSDNESDDTKTEASRESAGEQSSDESDKSESEEEADKKKPKGKGKKEATGGSESKAKSSHGGRKGKDGEKTRSKDKKKRSK
ncbi:hypothetical protein MFIFM68171_02274 [Madurella fahalii]|uniref:AAA+ ATPase domain-containing protein n=1 Tax=Madurella fahalii TaxID=1157608 RepID=A0ABQ0G2T3_9PEZI